MISLIYISATMWHVINYGMVNKFSTIELASEYLINEGIQDEHIDEALMKMAFYSHKVGVFNASHGTYSHTEPDRE